MLFTKNKLRNKINDFVDYLKENNIKLEKVILYGSYSIGNPKQDSDIDLAIWVVNYINLDYDKLNILSSKFYPIHAKFYTSNDTKFNDPFIEIIEKTGKQIILN